MSFYCRYVVIKGDGGSNSICRSDHHDCALILHKEWVEQGTLFKKDYNCYVVGYTNNVGKEIASIINAPLDTQYEMILKNAKEMLTDHTDVKWF